LGHEAAHRAVAMNLQNHGALELQRDGQERDGGQGATELLAHGRRVIVTTDDVLPTGVQIHQLAANIEFAEAEAQELIWMLHDDSWINCCRCERSLPFHDTMRPLPPPWRAGVQRIVAAKQSAFTRLFMMYLRRAFLIWACATA